MENPDNTQPSGNPFTDLNKMSDEADSPQLIQDAQATQDQLDRNFDPISAAKRDHDRKEQEQPRPQTAPELINGGPLPGQFAQPEPFKVNASINALNQPGQFGYAMYQSLVNEVFFKLVEQQTIDLRNIDSDMLAAHVRAAGNISEVMLHTGSLKFGAHQKAIAQLNEQIAAKDKSEAEAAQEAPADDEAPAAARKYARKATKKRAATKKPAGLTS